MKRRTTASPDDVWAVLADGWSYPLWVVGASRMRAVSADWPQPGAKLHRDDGFGSGAGVTRIYTDAVRGCLFVDLSVDAGVAAGRAGT